MMKRILTMLFILAALPAAAAQQLTGEARVVDAATLSIDGRSVRLYGIATPVLGDMCPLRGTRIDCGHIAATALMDLVAGTRITCTILDGEREPPLARCLSGGYDLSEGMVYTGWARPLPEAPANLRDAEKAAREGRHGLWRGAFPPAVDEASGGAP